MKGTEISNVSAGVQKRCDSRRPDFAAECYRQSLRAAAADKADVDTEYFMDVALADLEWLERMERGEFVMDGRTLTKEGMYEYQQKR